MFRLIAAIFLLIAVVGCTPVGDNTWDLSSPSVFSTTQERSAWLNTLKTWQVKGSFAVKKANKGWSGSFEWIQTSLKDYQIHFYGPFGAGNTHLIGRPSLVTWEDNDGMTIATTPDALVVKKTGYLFPVSYLRDWVLGRTAAGKVEKQEMDPRGRLIAFEQAGWQVRYVGYQPVEHGELPYKIILTHGDLSIKLILRTWIVHAAS